MLSWMLLLYSLCNVLQFSSLGEGSSITNDVYVNPAPRVPAMYVFGDSLSDVGNEFATFFYPYGLNFSEGPQTGRFCNGKLFVDFVAEYLGLPHPPAYKLERWKPSKIGFNYAHAGEGILPNPGSTPPDMWTLGDQVERFNQTIHENLNKIYQSQVELSQHLANSLFIIWIGSVDYVRNYMGKQISENNTEEYAQVLTEILSEKLKTLYELGARKALVMELGPIGCYPLYRGNHNEASCDESKNKDITIFNCKLSSMIHTLASTLPHSHFSIGKFYNVMKDALDNPGKYGLTNVVKPCCHLAEETTCTPCVLAKCDTSLRGNPDEFLFWDGIHPTQTIFSIIATECINGSSVCVPKNIDELVQVKAKPASSVTSI